MDEMDEMDEINEINEINEMSEEMNEMDEIMKWMNWNERNERNERRERNETSKWNAWNEWWMKYIKIKHCLGSHAGVIKFWFSVFNIFDTFRVTTFRYIFIRGLYNNLGAIAGPLGSSLTVFMKYWS